MPCGRSAFENIQKVFEKHQIRVGRRKDKTDVVYKIKCWDCEGTYTRIT